MTTMIKVIDANGNRLQAACDAANGRCRERTINARDVFRAVEDVEEKLSISKKSMIGVKIYVSPWAFKKPSCYKGRPTCSTFFLTRKSSGWYAYAFDRDYTGNSDTAYEVCEMPETMRDALIDKYSKF